MSGLSPSLISRTTRFSLERRGDHVRLRCHRETPCIGRQAEEVSMAMVAHFARVRCGPAFSAMAAGFRSGPPPDRAELEELLGPCLHFHEDSNWLDLSLDMLRLRMASSDAQLAELLETAAEKEEREAPATTDDLAACVRVQLARALVEGLHSGCDDVAQRLGLSARTLRRQLAERGHSYRALREQVLEGVAEELLGDPELSLDAIAERLQFSDVRALSNATRRWFGMTPQQYRRGVIRSSV